MGLVGGHVDLREVGLGLVHRDSGSAERLGESGQVPHADLRLRLKPVAATLVCSAREAGSEESERASEQSGRGPG